MTIIAMQGGLMAGGTDGVWTTATQWTPDAGGEANWTGYTFRVIVPSSALIAGSKVRLTCRASPMQDISIVQMYVGHAASTGDAYDFESMPTAVLFGGSALASILTNTQTVSDPVTFAVNPAKNLIISTYVNSGRSCRIATLSGWSTRYKTGNDASTVDATGYSTSAYAASLVTKIEVLVP